MPSKAIHDAYPEWLGDVSDLQPHVRYLDEFTSLYENIKYQRLIEHKERFRKYMDTSMLNAITNYRAWIYGQEDLIREVMDDLNEPLRNITFNKTRTPISSWNAATLKTWRYAISKRN